MQNFSSSDEGGVEQHETPTSSTNHNRFGTSPQSLRREQDVQLVRFKRARLHVS